MQISKQLYHKKILGNTAAGQDASAVVGTAIDVTSLGKFDRARLVIELGAVTSGGVLKAGLQECDTSGGTYVTIADLGDGEVCTGKSDNTIIFDVPLKKRYLKYTYQRTTANIELDSLTIELYSSGKIPVTQDTTVFKEVIL
jgi:hypothetical protein